MAVAIYDFNEIKQRVTCEDYLRERGIKVTAGRCAATWRGGKGQNVSVEGAVWHDFKTEEGGSVLDLCKRVEGLSDLQDAARVLGERFHIEPKIKSHKPEPLVTRSKKLKEAGYVLDTTYEYTDEKGKPVYYVDRYRWPNPFLEPPDGKAKEFVQRTPEHEGLDPDTPHLLYHLPEVVSAQEVFIVEGEKDVETLRKWGFVATTNSGGASKDGSSKWPNELNGWFTGKDVTIIADNDDAGKAHAQNLATMLSPVAKSVRSFAVSALPKGDVTDWAEKEGGTADALRTAVAALVPVQTQNDEEAAIAAAKLANETPFSNFTTMWKESGKRRIEIKLPRTINDLREDLYTRFLGFPRRIGGSLLFDHDKDNGQIREMKNENALFAWIGEKSKRVTPWVTGQDGFVSKKELFSSLQFNATAYEKISSVPDWPMRRDVYYTCQKALKPTPGHAALAKFLARFNPATDADAVLLRTFVAAPMFYEYMIQRPCWIIDAVFGQGAGKTTLAEIVAYLYDSTAIKTDMNEMNFKGEEVKKRIVSFEGRKARMLLVDNVRGSMSCPFLAELITSTYFSGRPPYGEGEERRPNDLTFVITANAATADSDISSRSIPLYIGSRMDKSGKWMRETRDMVAADRFLILGDILDILSNGPAIGDGYRAVTRTPEFERDVLWKMAGSEAAFDMAVSKILSARASINYEEERANLATETIERGIDRFLKKASEHPNAHNPTSHEMVAVWLRTAVVEHWLKPQFNIDIQTLRNMVDTGKAARFARGIKQYPRSSAYSGKGRSSGILYVGAHAEYPFVPVLTMDGKDVELALDIGWHHNPQLIAELAAQREASGGTGTVIEVPGEAEPSAQAAPSAPAIPSAPPPPQLPGDAPIDDIIATEALPL